MNNRHTHANMSLVNISPRIQNANQGTQSDLCIVMNLLGSDSAHNVPLLKVLALPSEAKPSISSK